MIKYHKVASFLFIAIPVLLIGGILQSCKSYDNYRPTKKDQKAIIENWLTIRKKVSETHGRNNVLSIYMINSDKIKYLLESRKKYPVKLKKEDSLYFYEHFFKNPIAIRRTGKRKKREIKIDGKKIDSMSYPLFSQDGKEAILYSSMVSGVSTIAILRKDDNKKWKIKNIFSFF
ncbi:hypothetical protein [Aquimarina rhabdastrellae]